MYNRVEQIGLIYYVSSNKVTINSNEYIKVTLKERELFKNASGEYVYSFITCYLPEVFEPFISEDKLVFFKGRLREINKSTYFIVDDFKLLDAKFLEEK